MCVNYTPSKRQEIIDYFQASIATDATWPEETWQDYLAPIIGTGVGDKRQATVANFGMVPKRHIPQGVKPWSSMNARTETIGQKRTFSTFWRKCQFCLVPMSSFCEPNWETGKAERWKIGMADGAPFAVAGLWRAWHEPDTSETFSFTLLTVNANDHPLLKRFHKPAAPKEPEDKRSLVIVPPADWDAWLHCTDSEIARSFLRPYPAELLAAHPAPRPVARKKEVKKD